MPTKAYFIGLGGCGLKTVSELQKRLCPNGPENQDDTGEVYKFTYIDVDEDTLNKINNPTPIIKNSELINIGDTNPFQLYKGVKDADVLSKDEARFKEWMIDSELSPNDKFTFPNAPLYKGALAERMSGRTAIYKHYETIEQEIKSKIESFASLGNTNDYDDIWVVASSCGGTGSSITLDILYMIANIVNKHQRTPNVKLVLYMPQPFIERNEQNENHRLNAFSYIWEINEFKKLGSGDSFKYFSVRDNKGIDNFELFKYVIPVDLETSNKTKISNIDQIYPTVAEMMYYIVKATPVEDNSSQSSSAASAAMVSNLVNDIRGEETKPFVNVSGYNWTRSLMPYGYRVVRKASEELKSYLKIRAKYDILKYGLLGLELPNDKRHKLIREFTNEYILQYLGKSLCDIDVLKEIQGLTTNKNENKEPNIDPDNLESKSLESYEVISKSEELTANQVIQIRDNINELIPTYGETPLENVIYPKIIAQIEVGIQQYIIDYGLEPTWSIIDQVDDYYLEKEIKQRVFNLLSEAKGKLQEDNSILDNLMNSCKDRDKPIKNKNLATWIRAIDNYKESKRKEYLYDKCLSIIDKLTISGSGYLEVLRRGNDKHKGLAEVKNKLSEYFYKCKNEYDALASRFSKSDNDVFTITIPNIKQMVNSSDSNKWEKDHLFDELYCDTIIGYDREKEDSDPTAPRLPIRKNDGSNCLKTYIDPIAESLIDIAIKVNSLEFKPNFDIIIEKLCSLIDKQIALPNTQVSRWLGYTLQEAIQREENPNGMSEDVFYNQMGTSKTIHVLYPRTATTPITISATRVLYACNDEALARKFGFDPTNTQHQFVPETAMRDRIMIIKFELGDIFASYKYFDQIKKAYFDKRDKIEAERFGCHLHKEFIKLDLKKSIQEIETKRLSDYAYYLFKMLRFQITFDVLKKENSGLWSNIFGIFDSTNNGVSNIFAYSNNNSAGTTEKFLKYVILQNDSIQLTINKLTKQDDRIRILPDSPLIISIDKDKTETIGAFMDNLVNQDKDKEVNGKILDYLKSIDIVVEYINGSTYKKTIDELLPKIDKEIVNIAQKEDKTLLSILLKWKGRLTDGSKEVTIYEKAYQGFLNQ